MKWWQALGALGTILTLVALFVASVRQYVDARAVLHEQQHAASLASASVTTKKAELELWTQRARQERDKCIALCRKQEGIPVPGYEGRVVCIYEYPRGEGYSTAAETDPISWPTFSDFEEASK
jgi:hypothetical protein